LRDKIKSLDEAAAVRERERKQRRTVVFTNGCFDLLHSGHVDYLEAAKREGDFLIVGLNSDASMRRVKGPDRPLMPERDRAAVLAGLSAVDLVVIFDQDDPLELVKALKPDVQVKGADWSEDKIIGAAEVKSWGGRVVRVPLTPGRSTSAIIEAIRRRHARSSDGV